MRNAPDWLKALRAEHGARVAAGAETLADAEAAVAAAILAHPDYMAEQAAVAARAQVAVWLKANASSGDLYQATLFPEVSAFMYTAVNRKMRTADMTAGDLEKARNMIETRTGNARAAADREWAAFSDFYDKVYPRLGDGRTVADVLPDLAAKAA